jgi:hypothetical protein
MKRFMMLTAILLPLISEGYAMEEAEARYPKVFIKCDGFTNPPKNVQVSRTAPTPRLGEWLTLEEPDSEGIIFVGRFPPNDLKNGRMYVQWEATEEPKWGSFKHLSEGKEEPIKWQQYMKSVDIKEPNAHNLDKLTITLTPERLGWYSGEEVDNINCSYETLFNGKSVWVEWENRCPQDGNIDICFPNGDKVRVGSDGFTADASPLLSWKRNPIYPKWSDQFKHGDTVQYTVNRKFHTQGISSPVSSGFLLVNLQNIQDYSEMLIFHFDGVGDCKHGSQKSHPYECTLKLK